LHQTVVRDHEFLQRRIDVVEVDVGNEAIDAGVDGRRSVAGVSATSGVTPYFSVTYARMVSLSPTLSLPSTI
jgi:hypothetical protein